ncbi:PepSY domain-containing protein [Pseudomonas sp. M30-35]|uniref:PepSY domain-containing protein n=1 Tax=Pseudomonas sp. M30-35 TaxID=1981174 RepID=UPI000B3BE2A3|nr:PepSY domain-containing protein [Pseudomonas sp. M30-35]ARU88383.1 peptidase [Pseudomonas sp. M30-35]
MKRLTTVSMIAVLGLCAGMANARDLGPDEAVKLRDAGTVKDFQVLNEQVLNLHPGGRIDETELEQEYGKYIYKLDIQDKDGIKWDVELDASTGKMLKNHQDD